MPQQMLTKKLMKINAFENVLAFNLIIILPRLILFVIVNVSLFVNFFSEFEMLESYYFPPHRSLVLLLTTVLMHLCICWCVSGECTHLDAIL